MGSRGLFLAQRVTGTHLVTSLFGEGFGGLSAAVYLTGMKGHTGKKKKHFYCRLGKAPAAPGTSFLRKSWIRELKCGQEAPARLPVPSLWCREFVTQPAAEEGDCPPRRGQALYGLCMEEGSRREETGSLIPTQQQNLFFSLGSATLPSDLDLSPFLSTTNRTIS